MSLGREIKKARIDKGWKQKDLQTATGLTQKYLSAVELDKAQPSFVVMAKIAMVLGMSLDTLARQTVDLPRPQTPRQPGRWEGKVWISPDIDAPDPELEAAFDGVRA